MNNISFRETPDIETSSQNYALRFSGKIGHFFLHIQTEATLQMLQPWEGGSILDVGGGHAQSAIPLLNNGYKVTVLGSAPECNTILSQGVRKGSYEFVCGDILRLPFPDRAFDIVISYRLISHVNQWKRLIKEMTRVARAGVIVDYPSVASINIISPLLFKLKRRIEVNTRHFICFRQRILCKEFAKNGFQMQKEYPEFFFPMVAHRFIKKLEISVTAENICRRLGFTHVMGSPIILLMLRNQT